MMLKSERGQASVETLLVAVALLAIWFLPLQPKAPSLVQSAIDIYQQWQVFYEWVWRHYAFIPGMQL